MNEKLALKLKAYLDWNDQKIATEMPISALELLRKIYDDVIVFASDT